MEVWSTSFWRWLGESVDLELMLEKSWPPNPWLLLKNTGKNIILLGLFGAKKICFLRISKKKKIKKNNYFPNII